MLKSSILENSVLNSLWFQSKDLKIWLKWVFWTKIWYFEFTFSVITIVLVILSSWNLVWVCFFGWKWPYGISDFRFFLLVTVLVLKNTCGWIDDWKKNVLFSFYKYQPITETKMTFGSFLGTSKWWYKVKYIFLKVLFVVTEITGQKMDYYC